MKTQQELADELGKSLVTIKRMVKDWRVIKTDEWYHLVEGITEQNPIEKNEVSNKVSEKNVVEPKGSISWERAALNDIEKAMWAKPGTLSVLSWHYESWVHFISTWILPLDALLGWGYRIGRIIEVAWWNNVGKTTIALKGAVEAQKLWYHVLFVDAENAMDEDRLLTLWLDLKKTTLIKDDIIESWFAAIQKQVDSKKTFVIFDSVWEAQAHVDAHTDIWETRMMKRAQVYSTVLTQIKKHIADSDSILILINQYYEAPTAFWDPKKTKWGRTIEYITSQRLELIWENTKSEVTYYSGICYVYGRKRVNSLRVGWTS